MADEACAGVDDGPRRLERHTGDRRHGRIAVDRLRHKCRGLAMVSESMCLFMNT